MNDPGTNYRISEFSGKPAVASDCAIAVVKSGEIQRLRKFHGSTLKVSISDPVVRSAIETINLFFWASLEQDVFGRNYKILDCEHIVAVPDVPIDESHRGIAGHIAYTIEDEGFFHIVVFHVWPEWIGSGAGTALLEQAKQEALNAGQATIKLGTTNDNLPALYFYQKHGFVIESLDIGAVVEQHGLEQPGFAGLPVRDEIHMRLDLP